MCRPRLNCLQCQQANSGLSEDHKNKIMDTVIALNILLDVPKPYTWIVHVSAACGVCASGPLHSATHNLEGSGHTPVL